MRTKVWAFAPAVAWSALALSLSVLAACDGAPSATPARSHASNGGADRRLIDSQPEGGDSRPATAQLSNAAYGSGEARREDAPLYHGKPIWAANKKHSAQENADYHFSRDADAVDAKSEDEFIAKVHAFIDNPPKGVEVLTRSNGDKLMYDPKANLFAVADKDGAPRTLFKPRDGGAYWQQQKDSIAKGEDDFAPAKRRSARRSNSDDNG